MDSNVQAEVPEFLAVPGLGVVMLRNWHDDLAAYRASIASEYERLGMEAPDDCIADADD